MRARRYERRESIVIHAPIERAYAIASDPEIVPSYAPEVRRIDVVHRPARGAVRVRSHIRVLGVTIPFDYRYRYSPPRYYGGVQERGAVLRGYFTMRFRTLENGSTEVRHVEGIVSRIPLLAQLAGWVYFRLLPADGLNDELAKLKQLVEQPLTAALPSGSPP